MTLAQLETFFWTAQLGSAQRASEHLNLAQPTISLRLKELQEAMGVTLLERTSRGLVTTAEGRALLPRVAAILTEIQGIKGQDPARAVVGPIRIGLAEGFAVSCLPSLVAGLLEDHPALEPEWVVSTSTTLEAALLKDTLDIGVLLNPIGDERLSVQSLGLQPTTWVVPADWDVKAVVEPRDLWSRSVISNPPPSAMHRQITGWFAAARLEPSRMSICTSVAVIPELVAASIGAGLLPVRMAERHVAAGKMRIVAANPAVENGRLFICTRAGVENPRTTAVAKAIRRVVDGLDYLQR
jgi:DNA-binding transcriptional LysR family regulator